MESTIFEYVPELTMEERSALDELGKVVHNYAWTLDAETCRNLQRALIKVEEAGQSIRVSGDSRHLCVGNRGCYTLAGDRTSMP